MHSATPQGDIKSTPVDTVFLHVTKECNLRCTYCYFSAARPLPDELTTSEYSHVWRELVSLSPKKVVFTGGEPLLREDIFELLQAFGDADTHHRMTRCLNTNGHQVTPEIAERLAGLVDEVRVSLDALEARNDGLRGKGNFAHATRAIDAFLMAGLKPKILITVTRDSLPDLGSLLFVLISQGLTQINLNRFRPIGRGADRLDLCVSEREVATAVEHAWAQFHPGNAPPSIGTDIESQHTCGVGRFLNIMPNGDVFPCHVLTQPEFRCGNLRMESLSSICARNTLLNRLATVDFDELSRADSELAPLTVKGACMGEMYAQHKPSPAWQTILGLSRTAGSAPGLKRSSSV